MPISSNQFITKMIPCIFVVQLVNLMNPFTTKHVILTLWQYLWVKDWLKIWLKAAILRRFIWIRRTSLHIHLQRHKNANSSVVIKRLSSTSILHRNKCFVTRQEMFQLKHNLSWAKIFSHLILKFRTFCRKIFKISFLNSKRVASLCWIQSKVSKKKFLAKSLN